ncbi:hypothetical protein KKF84_15760 [Myxococcota bacterium]|nr:hypothetical protein [Myxococcota bacterium]MBU1536781.1 hypothetical protein [Myxococcota bacterium]
MKKSLLLLLVAAVACSAESGKQNQKKSDPPHGMSPPRNTMKAQALGMTPGEPAQTAKAPPRQSAMLPPLKKVAPVGPRGPAPLKVPGFRDASHTAPWPQGEWPKPVIVILHGNFDRPEWECETWNRAAGHLAWLLCPRGFPNPWATKAENRWTYRTHKELKKEVEGALAALEAAYPGKVTRKGMMLAGFSLGAILAPHFFQITGKLFSTLFLVEGGLERLNRKQLTLLKRSGLKGIAFAMGTSNGTRLVKPLLPFIRYLKLPVYFIEMKGAGHGYGPPFTRAAGPIIKEFLQLEHK